MENDRLDIEKVIDEVLKTSNDKHVHMQRVRKEIDKMIEDNDGEELGHAVQK